MMSGSDNVIILSKQIRALLELCQNSSLLNMLQWIVGHPLLRPHQLSLAFYELTPEMNWRFVKGAGPISLSGITDLEDSYVLDLRLASNDLPWGFFNWNDSPSGLSPQTENADIVGLCLGTSDYSDGLLICASKNPFKFDNFAPIYSFIRVASEFVYRNHYLHSSSEMKANSKASEIQIDQLDSVDGENSLDERDSSLNGVVLTDRQSEILEFISAGLTNEEIATQMHLSLGTIRVETSRLYDRLGARNRQQAASLAHLVLDH